jgi:hypothetical protein
VDIGGNRELEAVVRLIEWAGRLQLTPAATTTSSSNVRPLFVSPSLLVVKSQELHEALREIRKPHPPAASVACKPSSSLTCSSSPASSSVAQPREDTRIVQRLQQLVAGRLAKRRPARSDPAKRRLPHPLKMPLRLNDVGVAICRYHNYDAKRGCLRLKPDLPDQTESGGGGKCQQVCPLDHQHCHACSALGHRALECSQAMPLL